MFESLFGEELQVNYQTIMESYRETQQQFDQIYTLTAALEAENPLDNDIAPDPTSGDKKTPGEANKSKLAMNNIVSKILDKLNAIITTFVQTLKNKWNKVLLTDKGFKKDLRDAEVNRKPLKAIKIITWEYHNKELDELYRKYQNAANELINKFNLNEVFTNPDHPFTAGSNDDFQKRIFQLAQMPEEIESTDQMIVAMKKTFRKNKKEYTYYEKDVPIMIRNSSNYDAMKAVVDNSTANIQAKSNAIINVIKNKLRGTDLPEENRKRINTITQRMTQLYNQYTTISNFYFELRTEYMINCRIIVRRFYQI